ncbi:hypothetical protein SASPL_137815 [Salvia splendens]|uniref:Uncharacterized protein n=1 Tax=Salvia splendens TaxID=180675 RepID=A0A8X8WV48_SALSN|nr:hypothetical protein SASPL_137815 [Salvia splendens]
MGRPRFAPAGFGGNSPPSVAFPLLQWTPSPLPPSPARVDRGPEIPLSLTYRRCRDTPSPRPLYPTRQVIVAACSWWRRWSRRLSLFLVRSLPLNTIRAGKRNVTVEPGRGRYLSTPSEQARGMSLSSLAAVDRAAVVVHSARRLTTRSSPGPSACSSCLVAVQFSLPLKPTRS